MVKGAVKVQAELGARHHRPAHVHNHLVDNYGDCVEDNGPGVLMVTTNHGDCSYNNCNNKSYNVSHLLSGGCTLLKLEWKHLISKLFVFVFVFVFVSYGGNS